MKIGANVVNLLAFVAVTAWLVAEKILGDLALVSWWLILFPVWGLIAVAALFATVESFTRSYHDEPDEHERGGA